MEESQSKIITSPYEAKLLLMEGNERFRNGNTVTKDLSPTRRYELAHKGQNPMAVIVSCSDSRVPAEILFDQALGDLFVVRVAGNVVTAVEIGSIEYAVEYLKTPLIVVLGHEKCGAISAAVKGGDFPGCIGAIAYEIAPSMNKAKGKTHDTASLIEKTTELNILHAIDKIKHSPVIKNVLDRVEICGGIYHLESGQVEWLSETES